MPNVKDMLAQLDKLSARQDELRDQLHTSLSVQAFMPDAFEHGSCEIGGQSTEFEPEKGTIVFALGNGEKREFPAVEVPVDLWPTKMREFLRDRKSKRHQRAQA